MFISCRIELKERFKEAKSIEQGPGPNSSYATGYLLTLYEKDDDIMAGINFMDDIDARFDYKCYCFFISFIDA